MTCNKGEAAAKLSAAFKQVDRDHSGHIDGAELQNVLAAYYKSAGKPVDAGKIKTESESFLREVDKNGDHKISEEEFLNYFLKFCK